MTFTICTIYMIYTGPDEQPNSVEGFLYNLFSDPDIIKLPKCLKSLQTPLAFMISKVRAPKSTRNYQMIANHASDLMRGQVGDTNTNTNINTNTSDINTDNHLPNSPINYITQQQESIPSSKHPLLTLLLISVVILL